MFQYKESLRKQPAIRLPGSSGTDAWEFWNHERSREGRGTLRRPDHEIQVRPLDPCFSSLILSNPRSTHDPPKRWKAARTYTKHQAFQLRQLIKASHLHQARTKRQADPWWEDIPLERRQDAVFQCLRLPRICFLYHGHGRPGSDERGLFRSSGLRLRQKSRQSGGESGNGTQQGLHRVQWRSLWKEAYHVILRCSAGGCFAPNGLRCCAWGKRRGRWGTEDGNSRGEVVLDEKRRQIGLGAEPWRIGYKEDFGSSRPAVRALCGDNTADCTLGVSLPSLLLGKQGHTTFPCWFLEVY